MRLRRKAAASRLKHDLGKAIRFHAPGSGEGRESVDDLRQRLTRDLLNTRKDRGSTALSAVGVFEEWKKNERATFKGGPRDETALSILRDIEALVDELRRRLPGLPAFEERQLRDLDRLSLDLHERCRSLWKQTVSSSNFPEGEP